MGLIYINGPVDVKPANQIIAKLEVERDTLVNQIKQLRATYKPVLPINSFCCLTFTFILKSNLTLLSQNSLYHSN